MTENTSEAKLHALDYWQVIRNRYGVILLAFFLVFMTAGVITYILPEEYLGKVVLEVHQHAEAAEGMGTRRPLLNDYQFIQT